MSDENEHAEAPEPVVDDTPPGAWGEDENAGLVVEHNTLICEELTGGAGYRMPQPLAGAVPEEYALTTDGVVWLHQVDGNLAVDLVAVRPFVVRQRLRDDRNESRYVLAWLSDDDEVRTVTVPATVVADARRLIAAFPEVVITSKNSSAAISYVTGCLRQNRHWLVAHGEQVATALGWPSHTRAYFVSGPGRPVPVEDVKNTGKWLEGHRAAGSLRGSVDLVRSVADRPLMQVMVNASLAAPMLKLLGAENFVVDLTGRTTGGKTTALRLAASVWGEPTMEGVMLSWKDSPASLEQNISMLRGMPAFIDETQHAKEGVVSDFIYSLSQGRSKGRSKRDGSGQQDVTAFQTIGMFTGEHSSVAGTGQGGVSPRAISLTGIPAASKEQADTVKTRAMTDFGHLGPAFTDHVITLNPVELRDRYSGLAATLTARTSTAVAARRTDSVAVLALTNELAAGVGLVPHLPMETWEWLVDGGDVITEEEDNKALQALREVLSWAVRNKARFLGAPGTDPDRVPPLGWVGRWEMGRTPYVSFAPPALDKLLEELRQDAARVRLDWRDEGWIKRQVRNGKPATSTTHPIKFNGSSDRHVIITNLGPITEDVVEPGAEGSGAMGPGAYDAWVQQLRVTTGEPQAEDTGVEEG